MLRTLSILMGTVLLAAASAVAPALAAPSAARAADAAYQAQDWQTAAGLYRKLADANAADTTSWFRLGHALAKLGMAAEALAIFEKGEAHGIPKSFAEMGLAMAYARSDRDKALTHLERAAEAGLNDTQRVAGEDLFAPIKSDARFVKILARIERNEKPCGAGMLYRAFDFWIGDWDVVLTGTDGPSVGTSKIELILNQCLIVENWTSKRSPYAGKSFNIYNVNLKRWEQYWADNAGGTIFFHGNPEGRVMHYWTDDVPQPDGTKLRRHMQFFNIDADTVRQFSQGSTDAGKTWTTEYDFTYHRAK